jgi:Xaa-Pro aminopeptidase
MTVLIAIIAAAPLLAQKPTIDASEYAARRARLAKAIGPNAIFVAFSPKLQIRSGDQEWPFRQSDDLLYLTGIAEEDTTLVMVPGDPEFAEVLFVRDRNPQQEVWTGRIPPRDEITKISGVKRIESAGRWRGFVNSAIAGGAWMSPESTERIPPRAMPNFYAAMTAGNAEVWTVNEVRSFGPNPPLTDEQEFVKDLRERFASLRFRDAQPLLTTMREVKSPAEIAIIQRAIDITEAAQKAAMKRVLTATSENQVDAVVDFTYKDLGTCCWGFPSIVASGANSTTLHYMANNAPVDRSGLFLTDLGAEYLGYSADVTRTYPASGKFTADQRAIHSAVYEAQEAAIAALKPGGHFRDADHAAIAVVGRELLHLGLITKNEPRQVYMYFRHAPGHHIGLDTHEPRSQDRAEYGIRRRAWDLRAQERRRGQSRLPEADEGRTSRNREKSGPLRRHRRPHRRQRRDHGDGREAAVLRLAAKGGGHRAIHGLGEVTTRCATRGGTDSGRRCCRAGR